MESTYKHAVDEWVLYDNQFDEPVLLGTRSESMSNTTQNAAPQNSAQAALAALRRAGLRAAQDALRTNTQMVITQNGALAHVSPQDYLRDRKKQSLSFE